MSRWTGPRVLKVIAVLTTVAAGIGFFVALALNAFVLDEYDAYGEVPIPGTTSVHLPAGDVTVSFHTQLIGSTGGNGLPVPPLKYRITGPDGADEVLTEDYGSTTTVNNDAHVRIGYLHVATEGDYGVHTDGNVSAYLSPRLAFGHGSKLGELPWILGAVFGVAVVVLVGARIWAARAGRRDASTEHDEQPTGYPPLAAFSARPADPVTPTDEGVRLEQLNTLARLRDSGALTQAEYDAEKKRVLDDL